MSYLSEAEFRQQIEGWNGYVDEWDRSVEKKCYEIMAAHLKEKDELLREAPLFMRHAYECRASRKLTKLDRRLLPEQLAQSLTCTCGLDNLLSRINSHVKPH